MTENPPTPVTTRVPIAFVEAKIFLNARFEPANQSALKEQLELVVLPRKGKLSQQAWQEEQAAPFVKARRAHSAVESAIKGLAVHGLGVCPDHGIEGFKRYVALAAVARTIHRIGQNVWQHDQMRAQRKTRYADRDTTDKLAA